MSTNTTTKVAQQPIAYYELPATAGKSGRFLCTDDNKVPPKFFCDQDKTCVGFSIQGNPTAEPKDPSFQQCFYYDRMNLDRGPTSNADKKMLYLKADDLHRRPPQPETEYEILANQSIGDESVILEPSKPEPQSMAELIKRCDENVDCVAVTFNYNSRGGFQSGGIGRMYKSACVLTSKPMSNVLINKKRTKLCIQAQGSQPGVVVGANTPAASTPVGGGSGSQPVVSGATVTVAAGAYFY